jgi:glutamate formiminotransferase/formiminotetrahydrofolate cyclodeaminase
LSDIWSLIGIKVMNRIIECVPNFSNGQNPEVYNAIAAEAETVEGVKLLNVDPGKATNRTVVTIAGSPEAVVEAAFRCIKKAAELIDMSKHKGEHPRMGATDVCPLVPISGISMEETAEFAKQLAKRVGEELQIPVYLYEAAQDDKKRSNLSVIREGEYEGFAEKIKKAEWKPDFGPVELNIKAGATVIGARDFLIAYNVNLNTTSVRRANSVAFDIREKGRVKRIGDPVTGEIVKDENGNPVSIPGSLKHVKAIGWFIEEYGVAQISMNLTNIIETPLHIAFDETCTKAQARGLRVTGSELVGLVPLNSLLDAGRYFLKKQQRSGGVSDAELIRIAVKSMGLDELGPFDPQKRVIEYLIAEGTDKLVGMSLRAFADETASESPAPGGGSIAAYCGAMGAALASMVANLSSHKRGWDDKWEYFSDYAEKGQRIKDALLKAVDEDTAAFNKIMKAFELPKGTDAEKAARKQAVQEATKYAIEVPFKVMGLCLEAMEVAKAMAESGNPNSVTDAGVGALSARTGVRGAFLNVKINASGYGDKTFVDNILAKGEAIEAKALALEEEVMAIVQSKIV